MTKVTDRNAFIAQWNAATKPTAEEGVRILNDNVLMHIEIQPERGMPIGENEVFLDMMESLEPRKGHGRLAMEFLCGLASDHGVDIVLHAVGTKDDSPSSWELTQFYKKHGFVKCGGYAMFRPAGGPA